MKLRECQNKNAEIGWKELFKDIDNKKNIKKVCQILSKDPNVSCETCFASNEAGCYYMTLLYFIFCNRQTVFKFVQKNSLYTQHLKQILY